MSLAQMVQIRLEALEQVMSNELESLKRFNALLRSITGSSTSVELWNATRMVVRWTQHQIAQMMGVNPNAIKTFHHLPCSEDVREEFRPKVILLEKLLQNLNRYAKKLHIPDLHVFLLEE